MEVVDRHAFDVTALADGGWVVTWQSWQDGSGWGIYQQRFDSLGNEVGNEGLVNTHTQDGQEKPDVTALADGGWVVTWQSYAQDGAGWGIYQQRFDVLGNEVGNEERVNTQAYTEQQAPAVTALADGGWVVTWQSWTQDGSGWGIYQQRFDTEGNEVIGEVRVNEGILYDQVNPDVTALEDGGWIVSWQSYENGEWKVIEKTYESDSGFALMPENDNGVISLSNLNLDSGESLVEAGENAGDNLELSLVDVLDTGAGNTETLTLPGGDAEREVSANEGDVSSTVSADSSLTPAFDLLDNLDNPSII